MSVQQQLSGSKRNSGLLYVGTNAPITAKSLQPEEVDRIGALLREDLAASELSTRKGAGGKKFTYMESWRVLDKANEVFGFNGWSSQILRMNVEKRRENHKYHVKVNAIVRITLRDGTVVVILLILIVDC